MGPLLALPHILIGQTSLPRDPPDYASIVRELADELLWPDFQGGPIELRPLAWCVAVGLDPELVADMEPRHLLIFAISVARRLGDGMYYIRAVEGDVPENLWSIDPALISFRSSLLRGVPLGIEIENGIPIITIFWHWVSAFIAAYFRDTAFPPIEPAEELDNMARIVMDFIAALWTMQGGWILFVDFSDLNSGSQHRPASVHSCHKEIN